MIIYINTKVLEVIMQTPNAEFNKEVANVIWLKLKGIPIPKHFTENDIESVLERYWHRAMDSE